MRKRIVVVVLLASVVAALPAGRIRAQEQLPTFRSMANAVAVDVTVRDNKRKSVTGLRAGDFEIYDNGVKQDVAEVSYGKLPIDVTVALDISFSVTGVLLERLRSGVRGCDGLHASLPNPRLHGTRSPIARTSFRCHGLESAAQRCRTARIRSGHLGADRQRGHALSRTSGLVCGVGEQHHSHSVCAGRRWSAS